MASDWSEVNKVNAEEHNPDQVDPFEDWEYQTRPDWAKKTIWFPVAGVGPGLFPIPVNIPFLQPIYVQLKKDANNKYTPHALDLRSICLGLKSGGPLIFIDDLGLQALGEIISLETMGVPDNDPHIERRTSLFLFRPETESYAESVLFTVLHVGPAIPGDIVLQLAKRSEAAARALFAKASQSEFTIDTAAKRSSTVLTAIIDDFIGIANERFRETATTTRIAHYWPQGAPVEPGTSPVLQFGPVVPKTEIDALLGQVGPKGLVDEQAFYARLFPKGLPFFFPARGAKPRTLPDLSDPEFRRPLGFRATHGTHVLDLAAGQPLAGTKNPKRPILAVQLPQLATAETWGARLDLFVLMGVKRILRWADDWKDGPAPVVINISYSVSAGPKDGSGFLEAEIARLVRLRNKIGPATRVVLPAGNSFRTSGRAVADLAAKGNATQVEWRVQPEDMSVSFLEIWLTPANPLDFKTEFRLLAPDGGSLDMAIDHATTGKVMQWTVGGQTRGRAYIRKVDEPAKTNHAPRWRVVIALSPTLNYDTPNITAPSGRYDLRVTNAGNSGIGVEIGAQRDDTPSGFPAGARQSYLDGPGAHDHDPETHRLELPDPARTPITRNGTLSAFATADSARVYVVGGAFDRDALAKPALYSSAGPTLSRKRPDLSAPTEETRAHPGRLAAGTMSGATAVFSGTSAAAPLLTRMLVDILTAAGGKNLSRTEELAELAKLSDPQSSKRPQLGAMTARYVEQPHRKPRRIRG